VAILKIHHAPDPILAICLPSIEVVTGEIRRLARDMIETMYAAGGVGLAANQVGKPFRLFVANPYPGRGNEIVVLNPVLLHGGSRVRLEEGCLSLPGVSAVVPRCSTVRIQGLTLEGAPRVLEGRGFLARIFQHEMDHLNGLTYPDRLPWLSRRRLLARYGRQQRELARIHVA